MRVLLAFLDHGHLERSRAPRNRHGRDLRFGGKTFRRAIGTTSWRLKLKRPLAKGRYVVYSRATDTAGQRERRFSARDKNRKIVVVR